MNLNGILSDPSEVLVQTHTDALIILSNLFSDRSRILARPNARRQTDNSNLLQGFGIARPECNKRGQNATFCIARGLVVLLQHGQY
jgi:hypothetical protein